MKEIQYSKIETIFPAPGMQGLIYARVDGVPIVMVVEVVNVSGDSICVDIGGVVDVQTGCTIIEGAGHPNTSRLKDVPAYVFVSLPLG